MADDEYPDLGNRPAPDMGLSFPHIPPLGSGPLRGEPGLEFAVEANFLGLRGVGPSKRRGGGLRGKVAGYSRASRKRLMDLCNQLKRASVQTALFVTLTYPDLFSTDPERWHRDLEAVGKRLARKYPRVCFIWRLEMKARKTGVNAGEFAPHLHLLVLGVPLLDLKWLSEAWYKVVGSDDERHLRAGTSAERARSSRAVAAYIYKYVGKAQEEGFQGWTGRVWGVAGRGLLPRLMLAMGCTWAQFFQVRRVLRRWMKARSGWHARARFRCQGLTAYIPAAEALRLLEWAGVVEAP